MPTSDQPELDLEVVVEPTAREQACQHLRGLLLAGAASPLEGPADAAYFDELRIARAQAPGIVSAHDWTSRPTISIRSPPFPPRLALG